LDVVLRDALNALERLVETPGDEPVSTYLFDAGDRQKWDFRANFTRSKYFYDVPQLFEGPVPGDDRTDDLHSFDLIRTNGAVDFTVWLPRMPKLFFGYRLYREEGDTTTTVDIPAGSPDAYRLKVEYAMRLTWSGEFLHADAIFRIRSRSALTVYSVRIRPAAAPSNANTRNPVS